MSGLSFLSGLVSHVETISETSGSINKGSGQIRTTHKALFRVNGKPVMFKGGLNLRDGDQVTLVGYKKGGEFMARAMRNDSRGVEYSLPGGAFLIGGLLSLLTLFPINSILTSDDPVGKVLLIFIVPWLFLGAYLFSEGKQNQTALNMLRSGKNS